MAKYQMKLKAYKKRQIKIARELGISSKYIDRMKKAKSEREVSAHKIDGLFEY